MKIEQTAFGPWKQAWRLVQGEVELIAVSQIGPRIISLRLGGGPNILLDDSAGTIARGDWHIWGGHRFWIAPETEPTYLPDNVPCKAEVQGETLKITAPADPAGLVKVLTIAPCEAHGGFTLTHTLRNEGQMLATGAIWGLTCVDPKGVRLVIPWSEGNAGWSTQMVRYWQRWAGHGSDVASRQWQPCNDHFVVEPTGEEGKIGLRTDAGIIALLRPDSTFVKKTAPCSKGYYPDGGCNLELYTCGAFVEMETLSPLATVLPGDTLTHIEHWLLTGQKFEPQQFKSIAALLA